MYLRNVSKNTARNPIAKAVARQKLKQAILDQKIAMYLLDEGADCKDICFGIGDMLALVYKACELDPAIGKDRPSMRVVLGGLSAINSIAPTGKWRKSVAPALDSALDHAQELNKLVGDQYIPRALRELEGKLYGQR